MKVGIPSEIKPGETRVSLNPYAVAALRREGHRVFVQQSAGIASGYSDERYEDAGAEILPSAEAVYETAELIVKVKEPVDGDLQWLRSDHILFSFLHLAPLPQLVESLREIGITAIAFETVVERGQLPILKPMSQIAGRLSVQLGTCWLHSPQGGKGLLLGGVSGVSRGTVVVLGAGNAGGEAALTAARAGARVIVFDRDEVRLQHMREAADNIEALFPFDDLLDDAIAGADLLIGAVLIPGAHAPRLVSRQHIAEMQAGSVVVDISIDQGGCIETAHATDYLAPTYTVDDVVHSGITNMPAAVARSATDALSNAVLPYTVHLANGTWRDDPALRAAVNVESGEIVLPALRCDNP